jgi:hypothetical protein
MQPSREALSCPKVHHITLSETLQADFPKNFKLLSTVFMAGFPAKIWTGDCH